MKTSDDSGAGRILVVEDDQRIARDLALVLRTLGFTVTGLADTASRAIDEVEANPPDLVLMDITLAGRRDGITAANEIRKRFGVPSIYLTAYSDEETLSRAEVTEPLGFLLKPFNDRELYTVIRIALYRRKMESQLHEAKEKLRTLSGLLQVCASCKKIRDEAGRWSQLEAYIRDHSEAECSHALCPECERKLMKDPVLS